MKKRIAAALILAAFAAGIVAGNYATRKAAKYAGTCLTGGYVISYRFGRFWQNELYTD